MQETSAGDFVVLGEGKFLRLVRKAGWEFVQRTRPMQAAFIGAVTPEGCLIVTEEERVSMPSPVIGCPAGLIGDLEDLNPEGLAEAVNRELREEAGYEATSVRLMMAGPTSPGQNEEIISIVLAEGLRKVGQGGGIEGEHIQLHEVPLAEIDDWLKEKEREGRLIDPKVYTVLYFLRFRHEAKGG